LQVCLIDGVSYKERGGETRLLPFEEVRSCIKFSNHKARLGV
jgi:hypothetical protein